MRHCNNLKCNGRLHPAGGALIVNLTFTSQYEAFQCIFKNRTQLYILTGAAVFVKFYIRDKYKSLPHTPRRLLFYSVYAYTQDDFYLFW